MALQRVDERRGSKCDPSLPVVLLVGVLIGVSHGRGKEAMPARWNRETESQTTYYLADREVEVTGVGT